MTAMESATRTRELLDALNASHENKLRANRDTKEIIEIVTALLTALGENSMAEKYGRGGRVRSSCLWDIQFEAGHLPAIYKRLPSRAKALRFPSRLDVTAEVPQHSEKAASAPTIAD